MHSLWISSSSKEIANSGRYFLEKVPAEWILYTRGYAVDEVDTRGVTLTKQKFYGMLGSVQRLVNKNNTHLVNSDMLLGNKSHQEKFLMKYGSRGYG